MTESVPGGVPPVKVMTGVLASKDSKIAVIFLFPFITIEIVELSPVALPLQAAKSYPLFGWAVKVTTSPES